MKRSDAIRTRSAQSTSSRLVAVAVLSPLHAVDCDIAIAVSFKATMLQRANRRGGLADEERLFVGLFGLYLDGAAHEAPDVDSMAYALEIIIVKLSADDPAAG